MGGIKKFDLNKFLNDTSDPPNPDELCNTGFESNYCNIDSLKQNLGNNNDQFTILNLNIQCVRSKFDQLASMIQHLEENNIEPCAITLQETWINPTEDVAPYELLNFNLISQGFICGSKGGLFIYLNKKFNFIRRDLYTPSNCYEALYIDVKGGGLKRMLTLGNVYRPPRDNNNNNSIRNFICCIRLFIELL